MEQRFRFAFDPRFRLPLAALGIWPSNCEVVVTDEHFDARYGPWRLQTPRSNLRTAQVAGPFSILKAIGPRGSLADRGATFGTTAAGGACLTFHEPVGALLGRRYFAHPGLTVTVEDPAALVETLDLPPGP